MVEGSSTRSRRRSISSIERPEPPYAGNEKDTLTTFLDYHRATLLRKVDGVPDEDLRRPMVPSGTTLLGMVKHLAYVERSWFQRVFAGHEDVEFPWTDDDPDADFRIEPGESTEEIVELYKAECEKSRSIVADASLDEMSRGKKRSDPREGFSLRWILVHMIEETARHNGHADILREQIDGATGE